MKWTINYLDKAKDDMKKLNFSTKLKVIKKIQKTAENPLPYQEGGYGKPLGNHADTKLAGLFKIKLKKPAIRIVYQLVRKDNLMQIIVVSIRDDEECYKMANKRIHNIN